MLGIRRETDYAVRTVLHLAALSEGTTIQVREVAEQRLLPLSFVRRIVARLSAAGIVSTTRGMRGGIRLARPAAEVSLLEVVTAMEGEIGLNSCVTTPHTCPLAEACPAQQAWDDAAAMLRGYLDGVRFDALAAGDVRHRAAHRGLKVLASEPARPSPSRTSNGTSVGLARRGRRAR